MASGNPLRILVITSRPLITSDGQPITLLDVTEERRRFKTGLKRARVAVHAHFLPEATTNDVQTALRDGWDVVHFTGHGTEDGRLVLEDSSGVAHFLTQQETAQLFTGQQPPLVLLSACYSETVGRALHGAGVPDIVAIDARTPIADLAAIIFADHFYSALVKGWNLQRAFDDAQRAVALDPKVGDAQPPYDEKGNAEEPWSKRFKLIGEARRIIPASAGEYEESGATQNAVGNLRTRNANFVGRAREIVSVVKAFNDDESPRVAIWGAGGLGKTELSKAVAWWYVERQRVDAVLWASASLAEGEYKLRDLASLLNIAGRVFRLPITEQTNFDEQKGVVREFLGAQRALVILDNWETIGGSERRELWDFVLSLPETTRVIVTSRDVLPAKDARNLELETLTPNDAVELFLKIARNAGYFDRNPHWDFEQEKILNSICERLSGYPLAIEVVGGQTVSRTLEEIWNDLLSVPKNVLEGKDDLTGEPRGVWTSLGLSYDALPESEKSMFRQMSIFLAPASAEDIATITTIENPRVVLDTLVKRSLVRMREGAYALLPVVRDYAESKLTDTDQDPRELHVRAINHYVQKGTIEGDLTASDHLFELATRFDLREAAKSFIGFTQGFYYNLVTRGYWSEARRKTEQLIVMARFMDDKKMEALSILELGSRYYQIGEYERAALLFRKAQQLLEEVGDRLGIAALLHQSGVLAQEQGNYSEATRLYQQSLEIKEELGNKSGIARSLHQLGMLAQIQGNYSEATRLYQQSLEIEEELGNKSGIADSLHQLGTLAQIQGNYSEATRLYQQSLKIFEELGNKSGIADSLHQLGMLAQEQGNYSEATRLYQQSLKITEELGNKSVIANSLGQMGRLSRTQGQVKEALNYFLRALAIFEELHSPYRQLAMKDIISIRDEVGEEKFLIWVKELSKNAEMILELLEQYAADEKSAKEFLEQLINVAHSVIEARKQSDNEQRAALAQQLAEDEAGAREQNESEVADFFNVLRGLLLGEDVTDKIAALAEPFKGIAEQVRDSSE
jgi:tetratricopeptide (TPR) repeat protein